MRGRRRFENKGSKENRDSTTAMHLLSAPSLVNVRLCPRFLSCARCTNGVSVACGWKHNCCYRAGSHLCFQHSARPHIPGVVYFCETRQSQRSPIRCSTCYFICSIIQHRTEFALPTPVRKQLLRLKMIRGIFWTGLLDP